MFMEMVVEEERRIVGCLFYRSILHNNAPHTATTFDGVIAFPFKHP